MVSFCRAQLKNSSPSMGLLQVELNVEGRATQDLGVEADGTGKEPGRISWQLQWDPTGIKLETSPMSSP